MKDMKQVFAQIPDVAVITDAYGYVLEYNKRGPLEGLRRGCSLKAIMPDFGTITTQADKQFVPEKEEDDAKATDYVGRGGDSFRDEYQTDDKVYLRRVTPVKRNNTLVGYTVLLSDITAEYSLREQRRQVKADLEALVAETGRANEKLEALALQAKELSDYSEQIRIARQIHDGFGHTITDVHTISQMGLKLKECNLDEYETVLAEGIRLCREAANLGETTGCESIRDLTERIKRLSAFPVETEISGEEPDFAGELYEVIGRVCKEAYHNTLGHSMADRLFIEVDMSQTSLVLKIRDNGSFHGTFEKGFGLLTMEDYVSRSGGSVEFIAREGEGFGLIAKWSK